MTAAILQELCQLIGYLLAHFAGMTAEGELVVPQAIVTFNKGQDGAHILIFESDSYQEAVEKGRIAIEDQHDQFRCWVFAYDVNLRSPHDGSKAGDAFLVEAGAKGLTHSLRFFQRYVPKTENSEFRLIGGVEPIQENEWDSQVKIGMEAISWRDFLADGAHSHPLVGDLWDQWGLAEN